MRGRSPIRATPSAFSVATASRAGTRISSTMSVMAMANSPSLRAASLSSPVPAIRSYDVFILGPGTGNGRRREAPHDVRVADAVHDRGNPEIARPSEQHAEEQSDREDGREHGDGEGGS